MNSGEGETRVILILFLKEVPGKMRDLYGMRSRLGPLMQASHGATDGFGDSRELMFQTNYGCRIVIYNGVGVCPLG
jgi:hypothetical protein